MKLFTPVYRRIVSQAGRAPAGLGYTPLTFPAVWLDTDSAFRAENIARPLTPDQRLLFARQYGSVDAWATGMQAGFLGAANTVLIDGNAGYFPPEARHGGLVGETRNAEAHIVTAESCAVFVPPYDLAQARRTVAMRASGLFGTFSTSLLSRAAQFSVSE